MTRKKWTQNDLPDLSGRTMVVTGASSGIGLVTARELCAHGAKVILAVRDVEKGNEIAKDFVGNYEVRALNLADLESVRSFADQWTGDLDVLINNAGAAISNRKLSADGIELTVAANHLGGALLTFLLLDLLKSSAPSRIITSRRKLIRAQRLTWPICSTSAENTVPSGRTGNPSC